MNVKVRVESIFQCSSDVIWSQVNKIEVLFEIASPILKFKCGESLQMPFQWETDKKYVFRLYLIGIIPLGTHVILVKSINNDQKTIRSEEYGALTKQWNHTISVRSIRGNQCLYMDEVNIRAGLMTFPIWCFAKLFYSHRHRKLESRVAKIHKTTGS
jgi:hypothetical protein